MTHGSEPTVGKRRAEGRPGPSWPALLSAVPGVAACFSPGAGAKVPIVGQPSPRYCLDTEIPPGWVEGPESVCSGTLGMQP